MVWPQAEVRAAVASDALTIQRIREETEHWFAERGIHQWGIGTGVLAEVESEVAAGEWFVGIEGDRIWGALRYLDDDSSTWPDDVPGVDRYIHGLMVDRGLAAPGAGASLLAWAEARAIAEGVGTMKLDCVESNPRLRAFYGSQGYVEVGRRDRGERPSVTLFEKALTASPRG